jgi:ABC-type lipoprotein export system ATPase subunit
MDIFKKLNQEKNITIILVTHEAELAQIARRRLHLRDGQIIKKEENA